MRPLARALSLLALVVVGGPAPLAAAPAPVIEQPVLLNKVEVVYPEELRALEPPPEGRVLVELVIGTDGAPLEVKVIEGVHPRLDAVVLAAVEGLRYRPATRDGAPIEVVKRLGIDVVAPPPPEPPPPERVPEVREGGEVASAGAGEGATADEGAASGPVRLRGQLVEAGVRAPISGAVIVAVPAPADLPVGPVRYTIYGEDEAPPKWTVRTVSAADGSFELRGLPDGNARIIALTQGFDRLEVIERIEPKKLLEVRYYQKRVIQNPYRTVVSSRRQAPEAVDRRSISVEEINNVPGTQGDALKSIQNFPGVARAPFGAGLLVIRGAAPSDSRTYLGYHEIPQLFHFGAITSVFNSDILAQIDFMPGNFDSRYGDAIGGIINVAPRKGRRDGYHGYVDADVFDAGILIEGPIRKGSFALSGRRSYIDGILKVALPDDIGLTLSQAPRYYDYQGLFDYPVGGGELSVRVFGSDDRLSVIARQPNESAASATKAGTSILFHRADVVYRKQDGPWDYLITPSFNYQSATGGFGDLFQFVLHRYEFSGRAEIGRQLSSRAAIRLGTEVQVGRYDIDAEAPSFPAGSGLGDTDIRNLGRGLGLEYATPALYATATIGVTPRFTLLPGARLQYYAKVLKKTAVDPRLRFHWQLADKTALKGGVGLYSQAPDLFEYISLWGNPRVWLERSVHTSLGVAQDFERGVTLEVTGFYKYVWDRVTGSTALVFAEMASGSIRPENFANQGIGRIYGGELLLRKDLTAKFFAWVSYTLMKSEVQERPGARWIPFDFDQRHILTAIAVYRLPRNWQIGGRFRLVSGNPTTARTDGVFDAEGGGYLPLDGPRNGDRLPTFAQLDLRVDKRWVLKRAQVNLYLDVQNVTNRQNGEAWNYSYNYQQRSLTTGLPIIPSLGTRIEF
ncbi:MAG: TonB-dependent receptor [Nannocystaceae bacterium]